MIEISSGLITENIEKKSKRLTCTPNELYSFGTKISKAGSQMSVLLVSCIDAKDCENVIDGKLKSYLSLLTPTFVVHVIADIKSNYGYLSAIEYPLRTVTIVYP